MKIVPFQKKIGWITHVYNTCITIMPIYSDDKELFRKCREIWNKINELISINNATDFVGTTLDDGPEFIMVNVHKNTSFVRVIVEINL